ncbi:type II toxin-antitoxin system RnlB family antitoxin [Shewanella sp. HN-41]|uniref:type II toxin-antitoxin system RnlB family antitoxin n=1 Tax=Shewanella sp. HN-41 TaxID=327275 RepID=UPI00056C745E|nr:type II toxin-antitoxin system RnlB family antitoxin [Shewanella sp. HN-41]
MIDIRKLDKNSNSMAIVTAISHESPLSSISSIEHELVSAFGDYFSGEVLFDLACSNGLEWNRFVAVKIMDGSLKLNSARVVETNELSKELLSQQAVFFKANAESMNDSVLTEEQILSVQQD